MKQFFSNKFFFFILLNTFCYKKFEYENSKKYKNLNLSKIKFYKKFIYFKMNVAFETFKSLKETSFSMKHGPSPPSKKNGPPPTC